MPTATPAFWNWFAKIGLRGKEASNLQAEAWQLIIAIIRMWRNVVDMAIEMEPAVIHNVYNAVDCGIVVNPDAQP